MFEVKEMVVDWFIGTLRDDVSGMPGPRKSWVS